MAHKAQPDPEERSRPQRKGKGPIQPPQPSSSVKYKRHEEQPEQKNVSKAVEEDDATLVFWRNVSGAFELCHMDIVWSSGEFKGTPTAKKWTSIIERRMQWMREDEEKLEARLKTNVKYSYLVDDAELKRTCRLQEDRLRQLSRAIEIVVARPSKVDKEYKDGETYDERVQRTLREVYDKCAKARKTFIRDVDAAVAKFMAGAEKERRKNGQGK